MPELRHEGFDAFSLSNKADIVALSHPNSSFWVVVGANLDICH